MEVVGEKAVGAASPAMTRHDGVEDAQEELAIVVVGEDRLGGGCLSKRRDTSPRRRRFEACAACAHASPAGGTAVPPRVSFYGFGRLLGQVGGLSPVMAATDAGPLSG